jgi:transcriptional regulator with XRE-family HTH domain
MQPLNGAAIRALRVARELPARDLAAQVGISRQFLCDIEKGRRQRARRLPWLPGKLADALGVEVAAITGGAIE